MAGNVHLVALPFPGRGHINPMMNLCKLLVLNHPYLTITFVVTEEWLSFLKPTPKPNAITFKTIPNIIPSELIRASVYQEFTEAVQTKMEAPVEELLNEEMPPVFTIIADTYLPWVVGMGNRRNIPVVSFWTQSPSVYAVGYHFHLVIKNGHFPANLSERGNEVVDYIPGIPLTHLADLPKMNEKQVDDVSHAISCSNKAQCIMFTSFEELEPQVITSLKEILPIPIYSVGPTIPHTILYPTSSDDPDNYFKWLNSQPEKSVLYISLGSFLSVSGDQTEEIIKGIRESNVRYLWAARGETSRIHEGCGQMGLVVPWCDQLKVLCHSSIGGFWTHCGWNSTLEGVYAGVPMLTLPIFFDQVLDQKLIVEDWKIGMKVKRNMTDTLVRWREISTTVQEFMDLDGNESNEMRRNSCEVKERCVQAMAKGGSSEANLDAFLKDLCKYHS